jgi:hypothetical protein
MIAANAGEWIKQGHFRERVQVRLPAPCDLNLRLEEKVELSGKRTSWAPRPAGRGLDYA